MNGSLGARAVIAVAAATLFSGAAQAATQIDSVVADREGGRIYVEGRGFLGGLVAGQQVYLGIAGAKLAVDMAESSNTHLEAVLPAMPDGEYQVLASRFCPVVTADCKVGNPGNAPADQQATYSLSLLSPEPGPTGPIGPTGPRGVAGPAGPQGPEGDAGPTGAKGATGAIGPTGPKGSVGPAGPMGPTGPQGTPGSADAWGRKGNAGTDGNVDFIGTTDEVAFEVRVGNRQGLRIQPAEDGLHSVLLGSATNEIPSGLISAIVAGTGNAVTDHIGTVSGGTDNRAGSDDSVYDNAGFATVGGGRSNKAAATAATIGGGEFNNATGQYSVVGGGSGSAAGGKYATVAGGSGNGATAEGATASGGASNNASGLYSTIAGGKFGQASGIYSTVGGGRLNQAAGDYSFAVGRNAKLSANADGSFAFADNHDIDMNIGLSNSFSARVVNGARFYTNTALSQGVQLLPGGGAWVTVSDRNAKTNFTAVDAIAVLEKVAQMPMTTWNYKTEDTQIRHMGPMAQDFRAAFGLGADDKGITTIDADGVALAAIQGLYQLLQEKDAQLREMKATQDALIATLRGEKPPVQ